MTIWSVVCMFLLQIFSQSEHYVQTIFLMRLRDGNHPRRSCLKARRSRKGGSTQARQSGNYKKQKVLTDLICEVNKMTDQHSFLFLFLLPNMPKKLQIQGATEVEILITVLKKSQSE